MYKFDLLIMSILQSLITHYVFGRMKTLCASFYCVIKHDLSNYLPYFVLSSKWLIK